MQKALWIEAITKSMTTVRPKRDVFIDALHIFTLCSFAVAQPLFDLLSHSAEFFVARHSKPADVLVLVLALSIFLPLLLVLVEWLIGFFGKRVRKIVHWSIVSTLLMAIALQALYKIFELPGVALLVGAAIAGIGGTVAYACFRPVRIFLTVLFPSVLIFPSLFLFNSPVRKVVFPKEDSYAVEIKVDNPPAIIMIVFDEFPVTALMDEHGDIDPVRYPNFAALAQSSYWFRNATTIAETTHMAIPAILTGSYPDPFGVPTAANYPCNLFTILGGSYGVKVFEDQTALCPEKICMDQRTLRSLYRRVRSILSDLWVVYLHIALPPDFTSAFPTIAQSWKDFSAQSAIAPRVKEFDSDDNAAQKETDYQGRSTQFADFLDTLDTSESPILRYLHILLPHFPLEYLPSGKRYPIMNWDLPGFSDSSGGYWGTDDALVAQAYQRHLLQVGFVDKLIGDLLVKLRELNLYDRSLIVITADHGINFWPGKTRRDILESHPFDVLGVPLFIKLPEQHEGVICDRYVKTIDILPTIAEILGIRLPCPVDGRSALRSTPEEPVAKALVFRKEEIQPFAFDLAPDARNETIKRMIHLFGSGSKPHGLFKANPHPQLIGREISNAGVMEDADVAIELNGMFLFDHVAPETGLVPALVKGRVYPEQNEYAPLDLAVSVNGIICSLARTYTGRGGETEFETMLPEQAFHEGKNQVEVFVVSGNNENLGLRRARNRSKVTYSVSSSKEHGEGITSSEGKTIPITRDAVIGFIQVPDFGRDTITFTGWAVDMKNRELPKKILVFYNRRLLSSGYCDIERPDVMAHFNTPWPKSSGFKFVFPIALFKDIDMSEIHFFAVSKRGVASELHHPKATYSLSSSNEHGEGITSPEGKTLPVTPNAIVGYMHAPELERDTVIFIGWAIDVKNREIPKNILVFKNGRLLSSGYCDIERPDVVAHFDDPSLKGSGFKLVIPTALVQDIDTSEIRFFAVSKRGVASELHYPEGYKLGKKS